MNREQYRLSDRLRRLVRRASLGVDHHDTMVTQIMIAEVALCLSGVEGVRVLGLLGCMPPLPGALPEDPRKQIARYIIEPSYRIREA